MTSTRTRLTSGLVTGLLVLSLGALAACGDDKDTEASRAGGGGSSAEQLPAGDEAVDTDGGESATPEVQPASSSDCLVGTWLADNKQLGALFKDAAAGTDAAGAVADPTGRVLMTFGSEGQYGVEYQDWTMKVSQQGMSIELVRDGTDTGTYEASDDGSVSWTELEMGSVATMKTPAGSHQVPGEATSTSGTFVCELDSLVVTAGGGASAFHRQ